VRALEPVPPLPRITPATADVLAGLLAAPSPTWGLRIVKGTGRPPGSVYPILERLEALGWVQSAWEDDPSRSGPRRRLYELTDGGAVAAAAAVAHAERAKPARLRPSEVAQ
jgi:PadR family transcriptional regulator, regulatory protein PadR